MSLRMPSSAVEKLLAASVRFVRRNQCRLGELASQCRPKAPGAALLDWRGCPPWPCRRSPAPAPGAVKARWQCYQVHRPGHRFLTRRARTRRPKPAPPFRDWRHRHRHSCRQAGIHLRCLLPGRWLAHGPPRRNGTGADDLRAFCSDDARAHLGRKRAGPRQPPQRPEGPAQPRPRSRSCWSKTIP